MRRKKKLLIFGANLLQLERRHQEIPADAAPITFAALREAFSAACIIYQLVRLHNVPA